MGQWIYEYECRLPLIYNRYDIRSMEERDSEQRFGLKNDICWSRAYEVELDYEKRVYVHNGEIRFCIQCAKESDSDLPEKEFWLRITGMIHQTQTGAYNLFGEELQYICYGLSLMLSSHNANKQAYQHRVKADYDRIQWEQQVYEPFIEWADLGDKDEICMVDGKETRIITLSAAPIQMSVASYAYIYQHLEPDEFWKFYQKDMNNDQKYLVHEYYLALGTESKTSKLYHLCSMIEYIEKRYVDMAGCNVLYTPEQKQKLLLEIEGLAAYQELYKIQRERFINAVSKHLDDAKDAGRDEKLRRILWGMGIREMKLFDRVIPIDKKYVHVLTDMRNTYFHGKEAKHQNVDGVLVELMQLGLMIVEWVLGNSERIVTED